MSPRSSRQSGLIVIQPVRTEGPLVRGCRARMEVLGDGEQICGARLDGCGAVIEVREELRQSLLDDARLGLARATGGLPGELMDVLVLDIETHRLHLSTLQRCQSTIRIGGAPRPCDRAA